MKCVICKRAKTEAGTTTLTFFRPPRGRSNDLTIVLKRVPAQVCSNCGEAYVDESDERRGFAYRRASYLCWSCCRDPRVQTGR